MSALTCKAAGCIKRRVNGGWCGEHGGKHVDHPSHYNAGQIEVIDAIEDWGLGFNDGNAVKYVARARHKGKQIEDLRKARWYIDREIARLEKTNG